MAFDDLNGEYLGLALPRTSLHGYEIIIDKDKLVCTHKVLYIFYHELGHIVRRHFGTNNSNGGRALKEEDADGWAFKEMGMLDGLRRVKKECEACYRCMKSQSRICLRESKI